MSEQSEHTGYFDEAGNELTVEEVAALGDDVEIVEEEVVEGPAAQQPAAEAPTRAIAAHGRKIPKGLIAGAAAVVVLVGGGVAYGMHSLGSQNTAGDVKAAVSSKTEAVKSSVASKSSEVLGPESTEPTTPARAGTRVTVDGCLDPSAAIWDGEGDPPDHRLRRESATELPSSVSAFVRKRHAGEPREVSIVQPSPGALWIYASGALGTAQLAKVSIATGTPVVLDTAVVRRRARDVGTCPAQVQPGHYAVVDGSREDVVELVVSRPLGGEVVYGITDDEIIKLSLEKIDPPAEEEAGGDASTSPTTSAVPSK